MRDRWEVLANYKMQRIPQTQIAEILGVSDALVSQEVTSAEFQEFYTEHLKKHTAANNEYDDGWDGLEKLAIGNLLGVMKNPGVMYDPKLNLQIAMVANKAQRRVSRFNHPLDAGAVGHAPVVINLRTTFVQKVQQNSVAITDNNGDRSKMLNGARVQNIPSPSKVEAVLGQQGMDRLPVKTIEQQADEMLSEVEFAVVK